MIFDNIFGSNSNKRIGERGEELPEKNEGYPDTHITSGLCSRCNKQSSFEVVTTVPISFSGHVYSSGNNEPQRDYNDQVSILECRNCNQRMVVIEERYINDTPKRLNPDGGGYMSFRGFFWWPMNNLSKHEDIPSHISSAYSEGITCLAASCPSAATVMFRRTLEAITVDKGFEEGSLYKRLIKVFEEGAMPLTFKEWVKEIRLIGNSGAHFDPINIVKVEDAKDMQNFIEELIKHIYIIPSQLNRRRMK